MSAPLLLKAVVIAQNAEEHSVQCSFTSTGQGPGFPVQMLYNGTADALRISQRPLPVQGTWGLVAVPSGDLRNAIWLGAYYPSQMNAITSDASSPFIDYEAHPSGFWRMLDDDGQLSMQFPDGSSVLVASGGSLPTVYRHVVTDGNAQERVPVQLSDRVPSISSPFTVTVNLASGAKITVDQSGNVTFDIPGTSLFGVSQNGGALTDSLALVSKLISAFNNHTHSGVIAGTDTSGPPSTPWTASTVESAVVVVSD